MYDGFAAVDRLTQEEFKAVVRQAGLLCKAVEDSYIVWEVGQKDAWVVQILHPGSEATRSGRNFTCYCDECFQFKAYFSRYSPYDDWTREDNYKTIFLKNLGVGWVAVGEEFANTAFPQECFGMRYDELSRQLQEEGFEVYPLVKLEGHPSRNDPYQIDSPVYKKYKEYREKSGYRQEPCSDNDRELTEKISAS